MGVLFDLIYDWIIYVVPKRIWWVLMAPLIGFIAIMVFVHFYPSLFSN